MGVKTEGAVERAGMAVISAGVGVEAAAMAAPGVGGCIACHHGLST